MLAKGTQSALLANYLKIPKLSTGEMLCEGCDQRTDVGRQAAQYMESGRLVPDPLVEKIVLDRLSETRLSDGLYPGWFSTYVASSSQFRSLVGRSRAVIKCRNRDKSFLKKSCWSGLQNADARTTTERLSVYALSNTRS